MNIFDKLIPFKYEKDISIVNLTNEFFALYVKKLFEKNDDNILIVTPSIFEAKKIYNAISRYCDCLLFELDDLSLVSVDAVSPILMMERLNVLNNLVSLRKKIVVTDVFGYLKYLPAKKDYLESFINISCGDSINLTSFVSKLIDLGYSREDLVVKMGDFAVRGYILDLFLVNSDNPVRIEFFGDEIESIRYFNPDDQRSISSVNNIIIYPFTESYDKNVVSISSYMDEHFTIFKDYEQIKVSFFRMVEELSLNANDKIDFFDLDSLNEDNKIFYNDFDSTINSNKCINYMVNSIININNDFKGISDYINKCISDKKTVVLCAKSLSVNDLDNYFDFKYVITDLNNIYDNCVNVVNFNLGEGFCVSNYVFLSELELFNRKPDYKRKDVKFKYSKKINDINSIKIGDYVVHELCGIGIYNGIKALTKNGVLGDYIEILYAKGDKLYIPASKIELISKFSSKEGYVPKISSLNSSAWEKSKQRVRQKVRYEAERLLRVQAERKVKKGFAFSKDSEMQIMFESEFIYEATDDQLKAIKEIKTDMELDIPMDRLLCGDVGYGKTEVAFRAMFKAVMDNKQVMYLCPTTLLSRQQYLSALDRFKNYPVNIALLNRFTSVKETNKILDAFKSGKIDILFGTHRILSNDIKPIDLGLLVIDEEQRFGVAHKEKIKEFKANIDVLTLTATPIPRTLQMTIFGLKDLSLIETPPKNRHAVQTYVVPFERKAIRDIVYREISRNGQVYILSNRIEGIESEARELEKLIPDANVIYAHGQMSKNDLENRMNDFILGKYNILLCTTIIETGVDIPNVNTLIVYDSDRFGLGQLYQIRGRVGRSDRIAYAYLTYSKNKVLTESAVKRLKVLKDFTELGSGFSIAARDLSIRGSGDILGSEQAGFISDVGIDLYMKLLNNEVLRLKGIEVEDEKYDDKLSSNILINNHIKDDFVSGDDLKIEIHKMINNIDSFDEYKRVYDEIIDRFGKVDNDLNLYMNKELFENYCKKLGVNNIIDNNIYIEVVFNSIKSDNIDYESLIVDSLSLSKRFVFSYKNNCLHIKVNKDSNDKHPIMLFNELFKKM